jgi:hypothetical protein
MTVLSRLLDKSCAYIHERLLFWSSVSRHR